MACYLGIFLFAETAFLLMAIREYLQDLLKIREEDLILGPPAHSMSKEALDLATPEVEPSGKAAPLAAEVKE
jgi:hypothetical protein